MRRPVDVLVRLSRAILRRLGLEVRRAVPRDARYSEPSFAPDATLPPGASEHLRRTNPRLEHLKRAYASLDLPVMTASKWTDGRVERDLELEYFCGDNPYVWQYRQYADHARLRFFLSVMDVRSQDELGLLGRLKEDGAFGCWTFRYSDGKRLSRDLLDSVIELNYLERLLSIRANEQFSILDIGAGYGRLAHPAVETFPTNLAYDCIDAIAESSFLCEYYLAYRGVEDRARSIAMDELHLLRDNYDLAVNIHSFSESPRDSIVWWLDLLREKRVTHLLIIPNDDGAFLSSEPDGSRCDFLPDVSEAGYRLIDSRPSTSMRICGNSSG
jgi:hypothetical protein